MCVAEGSPEHYTRSCPMCQVHKPRGPMCPHKTEVCRNRQNHPRFDVVYLINAEIPTFQGCGYCKWARTNQLVNRPKSNNPGWPGCCRAPQVHEYVTIPPADWPAVSVIHKVPIPKDIKQVLELALSKPNPYLRNGTPERKILNRASSSPSSTLSRSSGAAHAAAMAIPGRNRGGGGGSPQSKPSSLGVSAEHGHSGSMRRSGDTPIKRIEGFRTTPPASVRKLATDSEHGHPPVSKPSLLAANLVTTPTSKSDDKPALKRRSSASSTRSSRSSNSGPTSARVTSSPKTPIATKNSVETKSEKSSSPTAEIEKNFKSLKVKTDSLETSSDGGSRSGSADTSTITSDGAFTDYLSDESDAELQRQAEMRAVILEQQRVEEAEFRAARQQLASVDLRPPRVWSAGLPPAGRKAVVGGR